MSIQQEKLKAIADKIRAHLGTTDSIVPTDFPGEITKVYNEGYACGESDAAASYDEQALQAKYDEGYSDGYSDGDSDGYSYGYTIGYDEGVTDGEANAAEDYSKGYQDGWNDCLVQNGL